MAEDRAGNMTRTPKPDNWSAHYDLTWDAWNRLVKVMDGANTVATYAYDGRNFRVTKSVSGTTRHYYFNSNWQCLEERLNASSYAERQYVWGLRYIDDLVLRDRDADGDSGTGNLGLSGSGLEERLYGLQDANWNVVAISNSSGTIQERHCYDAYGRSTVLTGTFGSRATSSYDWETRYTGRPLDADTGFQDNRKRWDGLHLGRWLSRDPIESDPNLYRYCGNDPADKTDADGKVAVHMVSSHLKPACGGQADATWSIYPFNAPLKAGYIVQKVDVRCTIERCKNCPTSSPMEPDYSYWEAFLVEAHSGGGWKDTAAFPARDNRCGNYSQVTEIKFFHTSTTGDLQKTWQSGDQTYGFWKNHIGQCATKGGPLSTGTKPTWWDKPSEEDQWPMSASRTFSVYWSCCCTKKFVYADARPRD